MSFASRVRRGLFVAAGIAAGIATIAGCSTGSSDSESEGALTPPTPPTLYDQAFTCKNGFATRAAVRDVDLAEGVLRWACGDVNGVTAPDMGQEYCEFHAVMNGKVYDGPDITMGPDDQVECLFTSEFADASQTNALFESVTKQFTDPKTGDQDVPKMQAAIAQAQADLAAGISRDVAPQLKNAASIDPAVSTMQIGFNTRGAAVSLIHDCSNLANDDTLAALAEHAVACVDAVTDAARPAAQKTACNTWIEADRARAAVEATIGASYEDLSNRWAEAVTKYGVPRPAPGTQVTVDYVIEACTKAIATATPATKQPLTDILAAMKQDVADVQAKKAKAAELQTHTESLWPAVEAAGVTFRGTDEIQRDLAACTLVGSAQGVGWRNSDPAICARSLRAARCGYAFEPLPDALEGFELHGWVNRDELPVGCRYLNVRGGTAEKPFRNVVACTADRAQVEAYSRDGKRLQTMCRDKFGVNLALQAPLRAVARRTAEAPAQPARETAAFCSAFAGPTELPLKEASK